MANNHGHAFYVELQCMLVKDNDVESGQIMITALDITARKHMEAGLQQARDELELRVRERTADLEIMNQELQDFSFIASHDLQEPLRKVRTLGDMVAARSGDSLDEVSRDYIKRMQTALEKMQQLLDSLLVYSRVTTGTDPKKNTDLGKSVEAALSNLELLIAENNARVEVGELPLVDADEQQMVQVFQNLIGNAVKAKKKGEIPRIKIYTKKAKNADGFYNIYVEDNGTGFEERYLDKIFFPFQRLKGRSSDYPGVGMGLAICKKIIARHGGQITATSEEGKGSTFMFTLPYKRERR
jgi:light-regulated signal transduction histidine kinase (bacteriophytochrome)